MKLQARFVRVSELPHHVPAVELLITTEDLSTVIECADVAALTQLADELRQAVADLKGAAPW